MKTYTIKLTEKQFINLQRAITFTLVSREATNSLKEVLKGAEIEEISPDATKTYYAFYDRQYPPDYDPEIDEPPTLR